MSDPIPARTRLFQVLAIALAVGVASLLIWQASRQPEPPAAPASRTDDVAPAKAKAAEATPAGAAEATPSAPPAVNAAPATPKPGAADPVAPPRPDVRDRVSPVDQALYLDTSKSGDFSGLAIGLAGVGPDAGAGPDGGAPKPDGGAAKVAPAELEFERVGDPYWETSKSGAGIFKALELE